MLSRRPTSPTAAGSGTRAAFVEQMAVHVEEHVSPGPLGHDVPGPDLLEHGLRCGHEGRPPGGRVPGAPGHLNYKSLSYRRWNMSFGASRSRGARCYV